jgi:hypothetical protein
VQPPETRSDGLPAAAAGGLPPPVSRQHWIASTRRAIAAVLLTAGVLVFFATRLIDGWTVCSQELATAGNDGVVERCAPLSLVDLTPIVLLALLCLLPDLSELSVPGIASIKVRLDRQTEQQADIKDQLAQVQQAVSLGVAQETAVYIVNPGAALENLPEKEAKFRREPTAEDERATATEAGPDSAERSAELALLERRILQVWDERLWPYVDLARRARGPQWRGFLRRYREGTLDPKLVVRYGRTLERLPQLDDEALGVVSRWATVFEEELNVVRGARNAIAHPGSSAEPDLDTLRETVQLAERLVSLLDSGIETGLRPPD